MAGIEHRPPGGLSVYAASAATSLGEGVVRPVFAKRVYVEDVLAWRCGGRRRVIGDITQPEVITAILTAQMVCSRRSPSGRNRRALPA